MRQFNLELDKTSPKTSQFTVPANEHFSILVSYKNWEDRQEWLDYTLADEAGTDIVKEKIEMQNGSVLYFCSNKLGIYCITHNEAKRLECSSSR